MATCIVCKEEFKNGGVLARHLMVKHQMTYRCYYHENILKSEDIPKCKCGCGAEMKWTTMGYREFSKGHYSRVHNNWGNNPVAVARSAETRRNQFASGVRKVWNDGLTIGDSRVKNNIDVLTEFTRTLEERKVRSNRMRNGRLDGTVPTQHGPDHPNWKGGVSEINVLARARTRLYKEWKYPILCRDGFKCMECGKTTELQVHHDKERMCEIIERHMVDGMDPQTFEEKEFIADAVVDYHIKNKVSGMTICRECHGKIHPSLNFK